MSTINTYKVSIIGDGNVGKTTFIKRLKTGEFEPNYIPTIGENENLLSFYTNYGEIKFSIYDKAGIEKFYGLDKGYTEDMDATIAIFDVTSNISFINLWSWYGKKCDNLLSVVCGNKCDLESKVKLNKKIKIKEIWGKYYDISCRNNHNIELPFLYLARKLTGHDDLVFIEAPPVEPPVCSFIFN